MNKWISRKLIAAIAGVVIVLLVEAGVPETQATQLIESIVWIVSTYLAAQGVVDTATALRG
jgi:hypothetical protein